MIGASITLQGNLFGGQEALQEMMPRIVREAARLVRGQVEFHTPVRTGKLQQGWTQPAGSGLSMSFENTVRYGPILEFGLYPKEWADKGGLLFSTARGVFTRSKFEEPGGMLTPLITGQNLQNIERTVVGHTQQILDQMAKKK